MRGGGECLRGRKVNVTLATWSYAVGCSSHTNAIIDFLAAYTSAVTPNTIQ